jgi:hypothetical protein
MGITYRHYSEPVKLWQEFPERKKWCKKVYGHQAAITEVLGMAGKLLRSISPDESENRDAEYYKQALDLSIGDCTFP